MFVGFGDGFINQAPCRGGIASILTNEASEVQPKYPAVGMIERPQHAYCLFALRQRSFGIPEQPEHLRQTTSSGGRGVIAECEQVAAVTLGIIEREYTLQVHPSRSEAALKEQ